MAHRDFSIPSDYVPPPPLTFSLLGESFTCLPEPPAGVLNSLISGITYDASGRRMYRSSDLVAFIVGVLREDEVGEDGKVVLDEDGSPKRYDDVPRFLALINDKTRVVPVAVLGELVVWLAGEVGKRPSQPSTP